MTVPTDLRGNVYSRGTSALTKLGDNIKTEMNAYLQEGAAEMTQAQAMALQFKIQNYNILASTIATVTKELADAIKGVIAKV